MRQKPIQLYQIFCLDPTTKVFTEGELHTLALNPDFITDLCGCLNLDFDESIADANLCLANSREVRPGFRTTFNKLDIINYIKARRPGKRLYYSTTEVDFPENSTSFWSVIESGNKPW